MESLYNKIYKAINEGIQKALLIDPDQNDVSINYTYHKINNNIYSKEDFLKTANEFIEKPNIDNYNKVLKYSMYGLHQYKVKDFNDFSRIFNKIRNITDDIDLLWINTQNALTFIMNDKSELSLNKIDNKDDIVFIKFNNIKNFNHPIIIHKYLLISKLLWSNEEKNIKQSDDNENNGYGNTYNDHIQDENNIKKYPAFKYCTELKLNGYEGYLPAINELTFLSKNIDFINYILKDIKGNVLNININYWWSSTQSSVTRAWDLCNGQPYSGSYYDSKYLSFQVLPFFTKIN